MKPLIWSFAIFNFSKTSKMITVFAFGMEHVKRKLKKKWQNFLLKNAQIFPKILTIMIIQKKRQKLIAKNA